MRGQPTSQQALPRVYAAAVRAQIWPQPADDEQATARTISLMWQVARQSAQHPLIQQATAQATAGARSARQRAEQIFWWVKRHVRFTEDEEHAHALGLAPDTELIIWPADLLTMARPAGDCDDHATLVASMLMAAGIEPEFVTIAADPERPDTYSHVYARARVDGATIALDTSHGAHPGWEARPQGKKKCGQQAAN
jgi:transglutaminase-like putative cysteine protease